MEIQRTVVVRSAYVSTVCEESGRLVASHCVRATPKQPKEADKAVRYSAGRNCEESEVMALPGFALNCQAVKAAVDTTTNLVIFDFMKEETHLPHQRLPICGHDDLDLSGCKYDL